MVTRHLRSDRGANPGKGAMSTPIVDAAAKVFADPTAYTDEVRLHAALNHLRTHAPVSLVDYPPYRPFWAITKHADVIEIERANDLFTNAARTLLAPADPHGWPRAPAVSRHWRRLVSTQGDASTAGSRRRAGQDLCRRDDGGA